MGVEASEYLDKQASPQREILLELRRIFHRTLPKCEEKMAWGAITYAGGKFYIAAMKQRVHVGFAITGLNEEEVRNFEGSGKTMRHIKIQAVENINEAELARLIRLVDEKAVCPRC